MFTLSQMLLAGGLVSNVLSMMSILFRVWKKNKRL